LAIDISTLDQETITRVVADVLTTSRSIDRVEPMDTWRTRNSGFWRFRAHPGNSGDGPFDVVFKVERRWTPESAEGTHDALRRLSDLQHLTPGPSSGISFPEPLGWTREPPGVIMPSVEGVELFDALADTTAAPDELLPDTGVGLALERALSPPFVYGERYGTRCSSVVLISHDHFVFAERRFGPKAVPEGESLVTLPFSAIYPAGNP